MNMLYVRSVQVPILTPASDRDPPPSDIPQSRQTPAGQLLQLLFAQLLQAIEDPRPTDRALDQAPSSGRSLSDLGSRVPKSTAADGMLSPFDQLLSLLKQLLEPSSEDTPADAGAHDDSAAPTSAMPTRPATPIETPIATGTKPPSLTDAATSLQDAATRTVPTFKPVLRGDEATKDEQIKTQDDFARAADEVARDYGLDPNLFRAQLQSESGAMTRDFREAMRHEGDMDRAGENNTSIGLGQISRKFLDGREWSDGGPGNERMGGQVVSTEQYTNSPTVQLRMAASNLAQRVADHGGLQQGLSYYVSGNPDPANPKATHYLNNIAQAMKDPKVVDIGR